MNPTSEAARYSLPEIPHEFRTQLAERIFPDLHDRILGDQRFPATSIPAGLTPADFNPLTNSKLGGFVQDVAERTNTPYDSVNGSLAQIYVESGLGSEVFGGKATVYATTGVIYHTTDAFESYLGSIRPDILVAHKPVGSEQFRDLLRKYYRWSNQVKPNLESPDETLFNAPVPFELGVTTLSAYQNWLDATEQIHAYGTDELENRRSNPDQFMRSDVRSTGNNFGKIIGEGFSLLARQEIQNGLRANHNRFMERITIPLREKGVILVFVADNYMENRPDGKPLSMTEWAGEHNPSGAANVLFNPQDDLRNAGAVVFGRNGTYITPDGRIKFLGVPFLRTLSPDMRDPNKRTIALAPFHQEIQSAQDLGQQPILIIGSRPYLRQAEAWKTDGDGHSDSNVVGAGTSEDLIGALPGLKLAQFAHIPDSRRDRNGNFIPPNDYWMATHPTGKLRRVGEVVKREDTAVLHNPEKTIYSGVVFEGHPISIYSQSLPPKMLPPL